MTEKPLQISFMAQAGAASKTKSPGAAWFAKLGLWLLCCLIAPHSMAQSLDKPAIETEAQQLEAIRSLIREEKSMRLEGHSQGIPGSNAPFCKKMLTDLLANKGFKAIEPVAILNHEYPVLSPDQGPVQRSEWLVKKLMDIADKQLGKTLVEGLNQCATAEAHGDERRARNLFTAFSDWAGAPPYRVYVLPKKLNPFPDNQLIYLSEFVAETGLGKESYSWVNLKVCEHGYVIGQSTSSTRVKRNTQDLKTALTFYQGNLVAWDMNRNFAFSADLIKQKFKTPKKSQIVCRWTTYLEDSANEKNN